VVRVLGQQPGGVGPIQAHFRRQRPPAALHHFLHPFGIGAIRRLHLLGDGVRLRRAPPTGPDQAVANALVPGAPGQQLCAKVRQLTGYSKSLLQAGRGRADQLGWPDVPRMEYVAGQSAGG
jgi:hypothetical protein